LNSSIRGVIKHSIASVLILVLIMSSASFVMANSDNNPWFTFISLQTGGKDLDSDWPDPYLDIEGLSITIPFDMTINVKEQRPSFLSLAIDLLRTRETDSEITDEYTSNELHLGVRQIKPFNKFNLYWGGGLALIHAEAAPTAPAVTLRGNDSGTGYWFNAGFNFIFKQEEPVSIGLFLKYSDVKLSDLGVNGGGLYYGFSLGLAMH